MDYIVRKDEELSYAMYLGNTKWNSISHPICKALEVSGNGILWLIIAALVIFTNYINAEAAINLLIILLLDLVVIGLTKQTFKRKRPAYNKGMSLVVSVDAHSFPSGHCTRAISLCIFFVNEAESFGGDPVAIVAVLWTFAIAISRVVLGRHHVLDVLAGLCIFGPLQSCIHYAYLL
eukprot:m.254367 g.254367  ORF g.254367 m.254367 type:complete len:177 (-) comp16171_c0_seq7:3139-3669(-)